MLHSLFATQKPVIGMVHLLPLPDSPKYEYDIESIFMRALKDAQVLMEGGIDGILIENAGDTPFCLPNNIGCATIAAVAVITDRIRQATALPVGINIAYNANKAALGAAVASGASFIRSTGWVNGYYSAGGFIEPQAPEATRYQKMIGGTHIQIYADVMVKNGSHFFLNDKTIEEMSKDIQSAGASAVVVTGRTTGEIPDISGIDKVKKAINIPLIVGSGATAANVEDFLPVADGFIVGTHFREEGKMDRPVVLDKVQSFMAVIKNYRRHA